MEVLRTVRRTFPRTPVDSHGPIRKDPPSLRKINSVDPLSHNWNNHSGSMYSLRTPPSRSDDRLGVRLESL